MAPLFEIRMELDSEGLTFHPSLEVGSQRGFLALIEGLVNDIYNVARLIPRLAKGKVNYKVSPGPGGPALSLCGRPCSGVQSCPPVRQTPGEASAWRQQ